jgi:phage host-nuclease inhibitor protein Gam
MEKKVTPMSETHLEPRVAKLETGLEMLTRDLASLAQITREQGSNIETQIRDLTVAVTQAAAPRKTDWQSIFAALMLVMAIGSAVFWPLNQLGHQNQEAVKAVQTELIEHRALRMHPVGETRVDNMELRFTELSQNNKSAIDALDKKLQRETELLVSEIRTQVGSLTQRYDNEIQNLGDRLIGRLNGYDQNILEQNRKDLEELRMWRLKGMGLCSPTPANGLPK